MKLFISIAVGVYFMQVGNGEPVETLSYFFLEIIRDFCIQACLAAPSTITDRMIEQLRTNIELSDDVDIDLKTFESIMKALKKYPRTVSTQ